MSCARFFVGVPTLVLALAGCSGARPAVPGPPARAVQRPAPARDRFELWLLPSLAGARFAVEEPSGARPVLYGGLRMLVDGPQVRFATEASQRALVADARDAQGRWWFASEDGAVFRAESFLAPLEPAGDTGGEALVTSFVNPEVLVARDHGNRIFVAREGEGLVRPEGALGGPVIDVGINAQAGLVVTEGGGLWRTTDHGATATQLELQGAAAFFVAPAPDHFDVFTTRGAQRFDLQGVASPSSAPIDVPSRELDTALMQQVSMAVLTEHPWRFPLLFANAERVLGDGRVLAFVPLLSRVLVAGPDRVETYDPPESELCRPLSRGAGVPVLSCWDGTAARQRLLRLDAEGRWAELEVPTTEPLFGGAGGTLVAARPCDNSVDTDGLCFFDGHDWHSRALPAHNAVPMALWQDRLLMRVDATPTPPNSAPSHRVVLTRLDSDSPAVRELQLQGERGVAESGNAVAGAHFVSEHLLNAWRGDQPDSVYVGEPEALLRRVRLPEGAARAGFVTAEQGVAVNAAGTRVWATEDGGARWSPLALPVQPARAPQAGTDDSNDVDGRLVPDLRCYPTGCKLTRELVWLRAAPGGASPPQLRVAEHSPVPRPERAMRQRELSDEQRATLHCEAPANRAGLLSAQRTYTGAGGLVEVLGTAGLAPTGPLVLRWTAVNERGALVRSQARAPAVQTLLQPLGAGDGTAWLEPRYLTANLALLELCVRRDGAPRCLLLAAEAGRLTALPPHQHFVQVDDAPVELTDVLALVGGGVALHYGMATPFGHGRLLRVNATLGTSSALRSRAETVVQLDAHGAVVRAHSYAWSDPHGAHPLAALGARAGLLVPGVDGRPDAWLFHGLDGAAPEPVTAPLGLGGCSEGELAGSALRVASSDPRLAPRLAPELFGGAAATVVFPDAFAMSRPEQFTWHVASNGHSCVAQALRWDRPDEGTAARLIAPLVVQPAAAGWRALWLAGPSPVAVTCHP